MGRGCEFRRGEFLRRQPNEARDVIMRDGQDLLLLVEYIKGWRKKRHVVLFPIYVTFEAPRSLAL